MQELALIAMCGVARRRYSKSIMGRKARGTNERKESRCQCGRKMSVGSERCHGCSSRASRTLGNRLEEIKSAVASGESLATIGERYGVSRQRISQVVRSAGFSVAELLWSESRLCKCGATYRLSRSRKLAMCDACRKRRERKMLCACGKQKSRHGKVCGACHGRSLRRFDHEECARLYLAGLNGKELAKRYGVIPPAIYRCLEVNGVARRPRGWRK